MTHRIDVNALGITVTGPRTTALDKLVESYGRYNKRTGAYEFPASRETEVRGAVTTNPTGWSKASQRNACRSHPLGEVTYAGDGFTEYEDTAFGGGKVQIWDQS